MTGIERRRGLRLALLAVAIMALLVVAPIPASAAGFAEAEADGTATNNTLATAETIPDADFTLPVPATVFDPPGLHTASVSGSGGSGDVDFFRFEAGPGPAYFDTDLDPTTFDPVLAVFDAAGTLIAFNDDSSGDPGSAGPFDSFVGVFTIPAPGTYYVAVSTFANFPLALFSASASPALTRPDGAFGGEAIIGATVGDSSYATSDPQPGGGDYTLHVSINPLRYCAGQAATIVGTDGDDVLTGTPGPDVIVGLGGSDTIHGGGAPDVICGGDGDDVIRGGAGSDTLRGDAGSDTLYGNAGGDQILGGAGDDDLFGAGGNDTMRGQEGNDMLNGGASGDSLIGGTGDDDLRGGSGADALQGSGGTDSGNGGPGNDTCGSIEILANC